MQNYDDTFIDEDEPRSSKLVWDALCDAERVFEPWWNYADAIERVYAANGNLSLGQSSFFSDREFDIWWASIEIMKPAIYTKSPSPVVTPRFADRDHVAAKASEVLERCLVSSFDRGDFHETMLGVRDDLIMSGRGAVRITYETDADGGGQRVCDHHLDRRDFLHEPARKWAEVGFVAFAAYMTRDQFEDRFSSWINRGGNVDAVQFSLGSDDRRRQEDVPSHVKRAKVWEVWHKADRRVYWVADGAETFLDDQKPFIDLDKFFPCPKPAYGVVRPRSLVPVPDYVRYEHTVDEITRLTRRVYDLLDWVRLKGMFAGGGDIGSVVETLLSKNDDGMNLIPVPGAALAQTGGNFIQWLPIQEIATTIQGLIEARRELINNFYELSGISDILRGATEAQETLGAQQLKQQNGSIRIRDKVMELQRVAVDVSRIAAEIISEKFSEETVMEMAQIELPTKEEIEKQIKEVEDQAKKEFSQLKQKAEQMAMQAQDSGEPMDPQAAQQAEQQMQQAQQELMGKYGPQLDQLGQTVTRDEVFELLRKQKSRSFTIDIETDSTILVDENAEKASRAEFLAAFGNSVQSVQQLLQMGESGAKLAGGIIKFSLAPFRAGRELDGMIDEFVDQAPALARQMQESEGEEGGKDLAAAQMKLAEAEQMKAQAQTAKVQADSQLKQAELQGRVQEFQLKMAGEQAKAQEAQAKLQLENQMLQGKLAEQDAKINLMQAQTAEILNKIGLDVRKQDLEEYRAASDVVLRETDQAIGVQREERNAAMGEAQFLASEERATRGEHRADRQQSFTESQAEMGAMNSGG